MASLLQLNLTMRIRHSFAWSVFLVGILGCQDEDRKLPAATGEPSRTVDEIKESPIRYQGSTATVTGEVDKVFGDRVFEIAGDGLVFEKTLLVVTKSPVRFGPVKLDDAEEVVVRGTVRPMTVELERELGLQLPPDVANRYRGQPVLVASSVRLIETEFRWSEDYREGSVAGVIRLLSDLAPETFVGHAVDFTNLPVQSKTGRGLWVGFHRRSQLFVVPTDPALLAGVEVGDRIRLRGTVRLMPSAGQATRQFALDAATAKRAAAEEVFVEASEIEKTTPPPAT